MAIITSVGPQHLETFGSLDNVLHTKLELQRAVEKNGVCFINTDSEPLKTALSSLEGEIITCGEDGSYSAKKVSAGRNGLSFTITSPDGEEQVFETKLLGKANVQNLTLAIACAHRLGVSFKQMVPAVRALQSVPHRLELKPLGNITLIDDAYNSNPAGARMALDTLSVFDGVRILVTPGLVELGQREKEENLTLGGYAADKCDYAVLVGEHNRQSLTDGLLSHGFEKDNIFPVKTVEEAFSLLHTIKAEHKFALLLNDLPDNYL
jgi:UDP-N-acetylmuramoyl-tripeptide--D-alanyl-D-alanine ligase